MSTDSLAFRTARNQVMVYRGEVEQLEQMAHHQQAMECRDCESYLQLGIDSFHWLCRANEVAHRPESRDEQVQLAIVTLFRLWLGPCAFAEKWVAMQVARGFEVDNLAEFRACCEQARAIVSSLENPQSTEQPFDMVAEFGQFERASDADFVNFMGSLENG